MLLRHELPDGSWHFDLLFDRPDAPDDTALLSFRVFDRIDWAPGVYRCEPNIDHRRAYLTYEGPVSRNRGAVERARAGEFELCNADPFEAVVRWDGGEPIRVAFLPPGELRAEPLEG